MAAADTSPAPDGGRVALPGVTPAARWRVEGKPDPHNDRYDCERTKLALGHMTDDELANAVFMHGGDRLDLAAIQRGEPSSISLLTAAKDRIRWLSRQLETAKAQALAGPAAGAGAVAITQGMRDAGYKAFGATCYQQIGEPQKGWGEHAVAIYEAMESARLAAVPPQAAPAAAEPGPGERGIAPPGGAADLAEVEDAEVDAALVAFRAQPHPTSMSSTAEMRVALEAARRHRLVALRRPEPSGDAAGLIGQLVQASKNMDFWLNRNECTQLMREAVVRDFDTARAALSDHIAAQAARIADLEAELAALRTSAGAGVAVSAELQELVDLSEKTRHDVDLGTWLQPFPEFAPINETLFGKPFSGTLTVTTGPSPETIYMRAALRFVRSLVVRARIASEDRAASAERGER